MKLDFPPGFDYVKQDFEKYGYWEKRTTEYIKNNLKKGQIFLDIGGHVGYFSILASRLGARVIVFEPSSVNKKFLLENIKNNRCSDIQIIGEALSNKNGTMKLFTGNTSGEHSLVENYHKGEGFEMVEAVKFDDWNKEARVI